MAKDPAIKYTDEELKDLEDKIKAVYSEAESDIQKKMDDFNEKFQKKDLIYQKQLKDGLITQEDYDDWKKGQVFTGKQWAAKKNEIAATLHNSNKIATAMINGSTLSVFAENSNYTAYSLEHDAGANFGFGLYNTDSVAKLIKEDPQLLPKWKVDQKKDYVWNQKNINMALTQGIIQGESLKDISKRVSSGLAGKNQNLMNTFAKTGMTQAQNSGRLERLEKAKKLGLNVKKEWIATLDNRTRFDHQQLDGQIADTDGYFKVGGLKIRYPGDPEAHPSLVYNCRCALGNHLVDYPSTYQRYDNIDGVPIDGMTYREWKEAKGKTVKPKRKDNVANKKLIGGINDPELTDSIHDYFLPENTRKKLSEFEELHSYDDFKEYLDKKGIELDTDLEKLKTTMSQDDIPAVKEMMQKVVTAIDSYEEVYGPDALSALKRIKLYDQDLDTHAAYHFNLIGEDDPLAGTIRFSDWNASGRDIYHELAHAVQDSLRDDDEDVIIFANRLSKKVNIPKTAYSGTGELVGEEAAENMAENMAFGFARGSKNGMKFIDDFRDEMNDIKPIAVKKSTTTVNGKDISSTWKRRPDKFDFEIEDVINAQGFDGKPRVVSAKEFDKYVKESNFIAQRTYSAPSQEILESYQEQLYKGKWYVDCSTGGASYGQGMYCAGNYEGKLTNEIIQEMKDYQRQNLSYSGKQSVHMIETFTLDKSANIVDYDDIWNEYSGITHIEDRQKIYDKFLDEAISKLDENEQIFAKFNLGRKEIPWSEVNKAVNEIGDKGQDEIMIYLEKEKEKAEDLTQQIVTERLEKGQKIREKYNDVGSYAASKGYDAIRTDHGTSGADTVILNRTKCIFKGE